MKKKKNYTPENNPWLCEYCQKHNKKTFIGILLKENVIKIMGGRGQEYEIGFNYIEVTCPVCHNKCYIESKNLKKIQKYLEGLKRNKELGRLSLDSGEAEMRIGIVRPLNESGLKSFYSLEDRHKKILKRMLTEWQNKIYDCLCSMGLTAETYNKENWDRVTQSVANKLKVPLSKVEIDIPKIQRKIVEIREKR